MERATTESLIQAKLYRPYTAKPLVTRSRLLALLDEGLHRQLILVCAPAGFGKSALVSQWVAGCGKPTAWVSLDEGDNSIT